MRKILVVVLAGLFLILFFIATTVNQIVVLVNIHKPIKSADLGVNPSNII